MVFRRLRIGIATCALILVPIGPLNASMMTAEYTLSVEGDGPYEFSIPWTGESHWFVDGVEVSDFVVDSETGRTSGLLPLSDGETYSLQIQLIGAETAIIALDAPPSVSVAAAPEAATLLLLGFGLAALAVAARRQAQREVAIRSRR